MKFLWFFLIPILCSCVSAAQPEDKAATIPASTPFVSCHDDPARQALRSAEIQEIVKADQDDRKSPADWPKIQARDEARRKRVGEIFGEGCFHSSQDYAAAALVFQHGNHPDHFFQTFLWAKKAKELGDNSQDRLMAMGIDRYLVNLGHKQLFATQASKPQKATCWCLEQVEESFPEKKRIQHAKKSLKEAFEWINSLNADQPSCKAAKFCSSELKASPTGTVPGFW